VLHDLTMAARVADDVVILRAGRVIAAGEGAKVLNAQTLRAAYGVAVRVMEDEALGRIIVPVGL
jgi:iron complex transport system ATP-binding protein